MVTLNLTDAQAEIIGRTCTLQIISKRVLVVVFVDAHKLIGMEDTLCIDQRCVLKYILFAVKQ